MAAPIASPLPLCRLLATGGTIAMKADPLTGAAVPALSGADLLHSVPGLAEVAHVEVHDLFNIPSDEMGPARWRELHATVRDALAAHNTAGVVVSHGTDTMEETGWFLDLTLATDKPIVLVGAQRSASAADFDGPRNLLDAVRACVDIGARGHGVLLAMNGRLHAARDAAKVHTSDVQGFGSGEHGPLGYVDTDQVVFTRRATRQPHLGLAVDPLPRVDIVPMYAGADGVQLRASLDAGARGIVVQALGRGNVNRDLHDGIRDAIAQGVAVVISSRSPAGRVLPAYGFTGGGRTLRDLGAVFAGDLSPQKARILLMLALQTSNDSGHLHDVFHHRG